MCVAYFPYYSKVITAVSILYCYGEKECTLGGELGAEHVIRRLTIPYKTM